MDNSSFFSGFLTGKALQRGVLSAVAGTGQPDVSSIDTNSFWAGVAAGLCANGTLYPFAPPLEKPGTFDIPVTIDELMIGLYTLYAQGRAGAPRIYGMADMGNWLVSQSLLSLDSFYAYCQSLATRYGGSFTEEAARRITGLFFLRSYFFEKLKGQRLPLEYGIFKSALSGSWSNFFSGSPISASSQQNGWNVTVSLKSDSLYSISPGVRCPYYTFTSNVLAPGKYKLTYSYSVLPTDFGGTSGPPFVIPELVGFLGNSGGLNVAHSSPIYSGQKYMKPGESIEFEIPYGSIEFSYLTMKIIPLPGDNGSGISSSFLLSDGVDYTQTISCTLEAVELYPMIAPNEGANLTDLMRAADASGEYKVYYNGSLLQSLVMVDEYKNTVSGQNQDSNVYPAESTSGECGPYAGSQQAAIISATATLADGVMTSVDIDGNPMPVHTAKQYAHIGLSGSFGYNKFENTSVLDGAFNGWAIWLRQRRPPNLRKQ